MFKRFIRQKANQTPPNATPAPAPENDRLAMAGLRQPELAQTLLSTPRRQRLLEHIWQRTSLPRPQFGWLYLAPLQRYAELVQQFPASDTHHHAYPGGMLDHGLEIVAYALKLRQARLLPAGAPAEDQAAQSEAWTAACAHAALLHDVGKIAVDLHVEHADGTVWHPWHGPLRQPYRFRYRGDREYRLHAAATGLLYRQVLDAPILDWLCGYPALWSALLFVLAGQYEHAGALGDLVKQADQASVAQDLGGDPSRVAVAPKHALQRKLLDGLRYLLNAELKLNQPGPADGWLTDDALWLVSKTVSDKLRAHLLAQGLGGIPASNTAVFDVLQDHGMLLPTPDGKAVWRATIASSQGWSHAFTLLKLSPALIWSAEERPAPFDGTVIVAEARDEAGAADAGNLATPPATMATADAAPVTGPAAESQPAPALRATPSGDALDHLLELFSDMVPPIPSPPRPVATAPAEDAVTTRSVDVPVTPAQTTDFEAWLAQALRSRRLILNDAKALVHTVDDSLFLVSPGVGRDAAQAQLAPWQWVQKRFEKDQRHRKQANGLNIWTCEVSGPRKTRRLHGYLLIDPTIVMDVCPPNNPYLKLIAAQAPQALDMQAARSEPARES